MKLPGTSDSLTKKYGFSLDCKRKSILEINSDENLRNVQAFSFSETGADFCPILSIWLRIMPKIAAPAMQGT